MIESRKDHLEQMNKKRRTILVIRDGWGYRDEKEYNTIAEADTPIDDRLRQEHPWTLIDASGEAVGLPAGYQGNSEVGHMTIGSGRTVDQSLIRINKSIENGEFFKKREFLDAIDNCKENGTSLHLIGLLQKEGVHAHMDHLLALLDLCKKDGFERVLVHVITDGRDAPPTKGKDYLKELISKLDDLGFGEIVTVSGRYYSMDRDKRWERTKKAYEAVVEGVSEGSFDDPSAMLDECYGRDETDEFVIPRARNGYDGMKDGDSVIFYNSRTDRPRQLTQAIVEPEFDHWERRSVKTFFVAMTEYYSGMNAKVAFKEPDVKNLLGEVISGHGMRQLRISETEKYAHVTFFFNGQKESPFPSEERIMIPSPKGIATYEKKPEMSVYEIRDKVLEEIGSGRHDLVIVNLVNADMVGHSGDRKRTREAVEAVDEVTGNIVDAGLLVGYDIIVTADHGNAEDQSPEWATSHTTNKVPFIFVSKDEFTVRKEGGLRDIAPTILDLMGIEKPAEMDGESLLKRKFA